MNKNGKLGFILPHKFFNAQYGEPLRGVISGGKHLSKVVHFGDQQVFDGATTYTCLMFLDKAGRDEFEFEKVKNLKNWQLDGQSITGRIDAGNVKVAEWNFTVGQSAGLFEKLSQMPVKLGDVVDIFVGLQTSADDVFIMDLVDEKEDTFLLHSKILNTVWEFEKDLLFPIVSGTDVNRYRDLPERQYVLFPYEIRDEKAFLVDFDFIKKNYPNTSRYLLSNRKRLEEREKGKMKGARWYGYIYLKNMSRQTIKKICVPRLVDKLYAAYDRQANHFLDNVDVGGLSIKPEFKTVEFLFMLGLLNSSLLRWYFPLVSAPFRGGWMSANKQFLSQLPIHLIDFSDSAEKAAHDKVVGLVESMLALHKQSPRTPQEQELRQRQIDATDAAIDALVYGLYGLTEEEIKIVEGM